jgi:phage terminase large subunit-like protein
MIRNEFVTGESSFVDLDAWDACAQPDLTPMISNPALPIWIGVDASVKHDSTAIVAVHWDQEAQKVRLITHRVFQPSPDEPLDFEETIEATILELAARFKIQKAFYDPYQMQPVAQRLRRENIPMEEFPQSSGNLTSIGQNLYDLINGRNLVVYPDAGIRLAISRAVAVETSRGWRIAKDKASHKIDVVVALAMACHAAVARGEGNKVRWHFGSAAINDWLAAVRAGDSSKSPEQFLMDEEAETRRRAFVRTGNLDHTGRPIEPTSDVPIPSPELPRRICDRCDWLR